MPLLEIIDASGFLITDHLKTELTQNKPEQLAHLNHLFRKQKLNYHNLNKITLLNVNSQIL